MTTFSLILLDANALTRNVGYVPPTLSPSANQTIIDTALSVPELQNWSHGWKYVSMAFLGNNKPSNFQWQYAMVYLKAPSGNAPVTCDNGWDAEVTVDMTTMKIVSATYPTMKSHNCDNYATGGGPGLSDVSTKIDSPLKQFKSSITVNNVKCNQGFNLIIKLEDGSPACVKPASATKLVKWGWAKSS
jgi:hypothetical protein